jgi:hypothetical protein
MQRLRTYLLCLRPFFAVLGFLLARNSWKLWAALAVVWYLAAAVAAVVDAIGADLGYIRGQVASLRESIRLLHEEASRYKDPHANFTVFDALQGLQNRLDDPNYIEPRRGK